MSITESVIEFIEMVNRICQEQGLDIKEIIDKKDEFYEVFKEAGRRFDDINKQIDDSCSCKKCKKHETNIKDVEVLCNRKKADWEGKGNLIVIGLEMALTMLR